MAGLPSLRDIIHSGFFPVLILVLNILGAVGCGSYAIFLYMTSHFGSRDNIRVHVALIYLIVFSMVVPSAELGFMRHPHLAKFTRFLLSPVGRALLYIFMGGVILGVGIGGWVVGIYLLAVGVLNLVGICCLKD